MPYGCRCTERHDRRRVVLTGGPGAGKTAVLDLVRHSLCEHVVILPESAGIVYGGGFPRDDRVAARRAAQRAIFYVQRELEDVGDIGGPAVVLCDRGTVDGAAYWPGPDDLWSAVGTTLAEEQLRYDTAIHLRPSAHGTGPRNNPLRIETPAEAISIDERIAELWSAHPRVFTVDATPRFLLKAAHALALLREEVPPCCRPPALALD